MYGIAKKYSHLIPILKGSNIYIRAKIHIDICMMYYIFLHMHRKCLGGYKKIHNGDHLLKVELEVHYLNFYMIFLG